MQSISNRCYDYYFYQVPDSVPIQKKEVKAEADDGDFSDDDQMVSNEGYLCSNYSSLLVFKIYINQFIFKFLLGHL